MSCARVTYNVFYNLITFCRNQSSRPGSRTQKFGVKGFQYKTCLDFSTTRKHIESHIIHFRLGTMSPGWCGVIKDRTQAAESVKKRDHSGRRTAALRFQLRYSTRHFSAHRPKSFFFLLLLSCCLTSTEARWPLRDGDRVGRGRESETMKEAKQRKRKRSTAG